MRIAVVGGGIAGAMLAFRLRQESPRAELTVFTTAAAPDDATAASGGMVRGFETHADSCRLAAESLTELRGSAWLTRAGDYREVGSVYVLPPDEDPAGRLSVLEELLPGSARTEPAHRLAGTAGLRGLPAGVTAVVERLAGHLSPAGLRSSVLRRLAGSGVRIVPATVRRITRRAAVLLPDGSSRRYDMVVAAAGAWTPSLLPHSGGGLRTKRIQYGVYPLDVPGLGAFVDANSDLYGRPCGPGRFLLGQGTDDWDVVPGRVASEPALSDRVRAAARTLFGRPDDPLAPVRLVASFDCYAPDGGLRLRPVPETSQVFTFTGGSGGAAKTVLAASRLAARHLLGTPAPR
ncbi:NAD(P)/FAD-dependent oxidoreductase [Streptomyces cinereospinus]|uniref:NAD(P)/FAD-dependent oxidoreductase n=1 Tax=Streptomyces cinereospinus TaxID=285561 RepID=A0ABV5MXF8_9ACTN